MPKVYDIKFEDGASPEPHEIQTALMLKKKGQDILFLKPKSTRHAKTPDIVMNGLTWELKSPVSGGSRTIEHALRYASKQSANIALDLRRSKLPDVKLLAQVRHEAKHRTAIAELLVITKSNKLLDIK